MSPGEQQDARESDEPPPSADQAGRDDLDAPSGGGGGGKGREKSKKRDELDAERNVGG